MQGIGGNENAAAATGLGASAQFFGATTLPTLLSVSVSAGGYDLAYNTIAVLAALTGKAWWLCRDTRPSASPSGS